MLDDFYSPEDVTGYEKGEGSSGSDVYWDGDYFVDYDSLD